jgi:hypothetical protein
VKEDSQETTFLERFFGDFLSAQKVTGVWGEEPQGERRQIFGMSD